MIMTSVCIKKYLLTVPGAVSVSSGPVGELVLESPPSTGVSTPSRLRPTQTNQVSGYGAVHICTILYNIDFIMINSNNDYYD